MDDREPPEGAEPDRLDRLVDEVLAGAAGHHPAGSEDEVVAAWLRRVRGLAAEPLPTEIRERHLARLRDAAADAATRPAVAVPMRTGRLRRLRRRLVPLTAAALALVLLAGGGTVATAQNAGPDDPLYGIKRASERAWTALPRSPEDAAAVQLRLAERRLQEADRAPVHSERLIAAGMDNVAAASDELPEEAIRRFVELLGDGDNSLPPQASPVARAALHRNCVRISEKHDLDPERCGPAPEFEHPGRGRGLGHGPGDEHPGRGWGPGGRPEGEEGPPPRVRGEDGEHPGRGWGPGGRPDGVEGPPPGVPGRSKDADAGDADDG